MIALTLSITLSIVSTSAAVQESKLLIDGFAWAEQLAFDGIGGLFVSEAVRGELWRISSCGRTLTIIAYSGIAECF